MSKGRKIRRITVPYLERAALAYLERYASSKANLRRVLERKVRRAMQDDPELSPESFASPIEELVERFAKAGLVDDRTYAEGKSRTLLRRGVPLRGARAALTAKGIDSDIIDSTFTALKEEREGYDLDFEAGLALARRRRLGPFRAPSGRRAAATEEDATTQRVRDLAVMGRAGFSYDIARRVIDGDASGEANDV